jgi:hypothetical protein
MTIESRIAVLREQLAGDYFNRPGAYAEMREFANHLVQEYDGRLVRAMLPESREDVLRPMAEMASRFSPRDAVDLTPEEMQAFGQMPLESLVGVYEQMDAVLRNPDAYFYQDIGPVLEAAAAAHPVSAVAVGESVAEPVGQATDRVVLPALGGTLEVSQEQAAEYEARGGLSLRERPRDGVLLYNLPDGSVYEADGSQRRYQVSVGWDRHTTIQGAPDSVGISIVTGLGADRREQDNTSLTVHLDGQMNSYNDGGNMVQTDIVHGGGAGTENGVNFALEYHHHGGDDRARMLPGREASHGVAAMASPQESVWINAAETGGRMDVEYFGTEDSLYLDGFGPARDAAEMLREAGVTLSLGACSAEEAQVAEYDRDLDRYRVNCGVGRE